MSDGTRLPQVESLEKRALLSASASHALLISVDGLRQADITDPALRKDVGNILALQKRGVSYANASTTKPSDSFPGTLAYLTGAGPGTTGIFYDDSYDRSLFAPGADTSAAPGTETQFAENVDKNSDLLSGGGNFDVSSIDPNKLPIDSHGHVIYPHQFLKVNTIFNVAHNAGLHTAFSDKHPAYDIANGPSGDGVDDFFAPEVNSLAALYDPKTGKTVNADALQTAHPFADVSKYLLVDPSTDPVMRDPKTGMSSDPNLETPTNNSLITQRYDDIKVQAILNEIKGRNSRGNKNAAVPNLFGFNFQAVSVAEKDAKGGINLINGKEVPSKNFEAALAHTDASIGKIVAALKARHLWSSTLVFVLAKHGQNPRVGSASLMSGNVLPDLLAKAGAPVAMSTQDDGSLLWLNDQAATHKAVAALQSFQKTGRIDVYFKGVKKNVAASEVISGILSGAALKGIGFGDASKNTRTPDVVVTLKPGFIIVGNPLKFGHKNAEHGGFNPDDTHIALIAGGGAISASHQGTTVSQAVQTTQVAVSTLKALGLDPRRLEGASIENTSALPGLNV